MRFPGVIAALLGAMVLSGCLADDRDEEPEGHAPVLPSLADFEECSFLYPDNATPVPCENTFGEGIITGTENPTLVPDGWVCTDRIETDDPQGTEIWSHWHPLEEKYGLYYEDRSEGTDPIQGFLYNENGTGVSWYSTERTGFVEMPYLGAGTLQLRIFSHGYESDTPALADGTLRVHWSFRDGTAYPLQVLTTAAGTYHFHNVTGGQSAEEYFRYYPEPFHLTGTDFNLSVHANTLRETGFYLESGLRPACQTGIPP